MIVGATDEDTVVEFDVVAGQRHDAPLLKPLLKKALKRVPEIEEVVGDRGFDGGPQRQACFDLGTMPQIPGKSNQHEPAEVYGEAYRERNRVERLFAKMKQFRRVATRYEKLKATFKGLLNLVFGFIKLRAIVNRA